MPLHFTAAADDDREQKTPTVCCSCWNCCCLRRVIFWLDTHHHHHHHHHARTNIHIRHFHFCYHQKFTTADFDACNYIFKDSYRCGARCILTFVPNDLLELHFSLTSPAAYIYTYSRSSFLCLYTWYTHTQLKWKLWQGLSCALSHAKIWFGRAKKEKRHKTERKSSRFLLLLGVVVFRSSGTANDADRNLKIKINSSKPQNNKWSEQ